MAKRNFRLPGEEELNKDQDRVLALPEGGQYLIVGGPGTGKSVVALLRALKYQDNNDYVFLVYNKLLKALSRQLLNTKSNKYLTILHWFYHAYEQLTNEHSSPKKSNNGYSLPDYDAIINKFKQLELSPRSLHIIIDEGQDMPQPFYESLQYAGYQNFFIVADQNQQITEDHSSRQELTDMLGLEPEDVIELKINYRNSYPIAVFARHFYTDKATPPPELPGRVSLETPVLYNTLKNETIFDIILREADKDDRKLIGVIVANDVVRNRYVNGIRNLNIRLDNPSPVISSYSSKDKNSVNIDFSQGGIVILNDKSIKGLEFDVVYIILDDFRIYNNDKTSMKKCLYVMSSRAIEKLVLVSTQREPAIISLLPKDDTIMKIVNGIEVQPEQVVSSDDFADDIPF
jgi:DNA helicase IV